MSFVKLRACRGVKMYKNNLVFTIENAVWRIKIETHHSVATDHRLSCHSGGTSKSKYLLVMRKTDSIDH